MLEVLEARVSHELTVRKCRHELRPLMSWVDSLDTDSVSCRIGPMT
jgi:hypothetical protein